MLAKLKVGNESVFIPCIASLSLFWRHFYLLWPVAHGKDLGPYCIYYSTVVPVDSALLRVMDRPMMFCASNFLSQKLATSPNIQHQRLTMARGKKKGGNKRRGDSSEEDEGPPKQQKEQEQSKGKSRKEKRLAKQAKQKQHQQHDSDDDDLLPAIPKNDYGSDSEEEDEMPSPKGRNKKKNEGSPRQQVWRC